MVRITNGSREITVTSGVYREVYAPDGWEILDEKKETVSADSLPDEGEKTSEKTKNGSDYEDIEIPISEMSVKQLRQYAVDHSIDTSAAKNKKELRDIVIAGMEE